MYAVAGPSRSSQPQPGDGAYLATSQPGDGRFLANGHSHGPHSNGRGRGFSRGGPRGVLRSRGRGRGGFQGGQDGMNHHSNGISTGQQYAADSNGTASTSGTHAPSGPSNINHIDPPVSISTRPPQSLGPAKRPQKPRDIVPIPSAVSQPVTQNGDGAAAPTDTDAPATKKKNKRKPKPKGDTAALVNGDAIKLDPSTPAFRPQGSGTSTTPSTRPSSPSHASANGYAGPSKARKPKNQRIKAAIPPPAAEMVPAVKSSRRAAFDQQTKLTTSADRASSTATSPSAHSAGLPEEVKEVPKKVGNRRKEEKDDLVSRLTRGLKSRPYLECPICFNSITPHQPIWSCFPPTTPPPPPSFPDEIPVNPSQHYSACYTPFHLSCIRDWASRSLVEERERARGFGKDEEDVSWRCPGCQKRRKESVGGYRCFCGRVANPTHAGAGNVPHGCGEGCSKKRPGCSHACPLPCHPGPCPPCQVALIVPCPSHHTPLTVKCAVASSNNAALTPVCDEICERERDCGNKDHACKDLCHYGPCSPCNAVETVRCYCDSDTKEVSCGWNRSEEKMCSKLGEDSKEELWAGRYSCGKACEGIYDCGIHPCEMKCHPHPIRPLVCPMSPSKISHCACGQTPLALLSAPPRKDCLAPIPTCGSRCPKSRPCGHQCTLNCHSGPCPPCHEEVVKPCRCGESMLLLGCDELRDIAEKGGDVTCERICKALRNCGRHECGRICCPLAYQAKNRKAKRNELNGISGSDDLHECHLTCGRLLSCGLHTCQRKDHKGACGRCLQASYDELICHCGHTVVYPPVACGTTLNCLYPCARPAPPCGHPRTPHQCHESPQCPPCPFLVAKPCACGKDPSVKNIRCSQEKVSCGQQCGELLGCGYHRCQKSCHSPGQCEECRQTCNKPKKVCGHPCTQPCHAPAKCPETDPCQAIVTMSCACGHVQQRTSCGASQGNTTSREKTTLKCNSECAVRQRNARLADALGITGPSGRGSEVEWETELKGFAQANLGFVKMVEGTLDGFIKGTKGSLILPYMPPAKRTFVMSLADVYRLGRELVDQEPNRSVMIRRKPESRVPTPLLSSITQPPPSGKNLGGLANLRSTTGSSTTHTHTTTSAPAVKAAWGGSTSTPRPWTAAAALSGNNGNTGSAGSSRATTPQPSTSAKVPTPVAPLASGSGAVASSSTIAGAGVGGGHRSEKVMGEVGKVDDGDWDVSDTE